MPGRERSRQRSTRRESRERPTRRRESRRRTTRRCESRERTVSRRRVRESRFDSQGWGKVTLTPRFVMTPRERIDLRPNNKTLAGLSCDRTDCPATEQRIVLLEPNPSWGEKKKEVVLPQTPQDSENEGAVNKGGEKEPTKRTRRRQREERKNKEAKKKLEETTEQLQKTTEKLQKTEEERNKLAEYRDKAKQLIGYKNSIGQ